MTEIDSSSAEPVEAVLSQALGFDGDDIRANRDGYMTKRQRRRLQRIAGVYSVALWTGVLVVLLMLALGVFGLMVIRNIASHKEILVLTIGVLGFSIWLMAILSNFNQERRDLKNDLDKGGVEAVTGSVEHFRKNPTGKNKSTEHYIIIEDLTFEVSRTGYDAFLDNAFYALYYTPHGLRLLSAEPISQPDAKGQPDSAE